MKGTNLTQNILQKTRMPLVPKSERTFKKDDCNRPINVSHKYRFKNPKQHMNKWNATISKTKNESYVLFHIHRMLLIPMALLMYG